MDGMAKDGRLEVLPLRFHSTVEETEGSTQGWFSSGSRDTLCVRPGTVNGPEPPTEGFLGCALLGKTPPEPSTQRS